MVRRLGGLRRLDLADQIADRDAVEVGNLRQNIDIRDALSALPFGDGFVGIIQLLGKPGLCVLMGLSVGGNVFGDGSAQCGFIDLQGRASF